MQREIYLHKVYMPLYLPKFWDIFLAPPGIIVTRFLTKNFSHTECKHVMKQAYHSRQKVQIN